MGGKKCIDVLSINSIQVQMIILPEQEKDYLAIKKVNDLAFGQENEV